MEQIPAGGGPLLRPTNPKDSFGFVPLPRPPRTQEHPAPDPFSVASPGLAAGGGHAEVVGEYDGGSEPLAHRLPVNRSGERPSHRRDRGPARCGNRTARTPITPCDRPERRRSALPRSLHPAQTREGRLCPAGSRRSPRCPCREGDLPAGSEGRRNRHATCTRTGRFRAVRFFGVKSPKGPGQAGGWWW